MEKNKKKFKISGKLVFNVAVFLITVYMIFYFFASEDGLIDLLSTPNSFSIGWLVVAFLVYLSNTFVDAIVTLIFMRSKYKNFSFWESSKIAFVGVFFSAITPSSTGGQPMQLYLMSKKNISVGYGSACMTQKFIVYQVVTTVFSIIAVIFKFEYFQSAFTNIWSTLFVIMGFTFQMIVTAMFLVVSFCEGLTKKLINLIYRIIKKFKFIKNPEKIIETLTSEVEVFHSGNRKLMSNKKLLISSYLLVIFQVFLILSVPYFIYISFDMPAIAITNGQTPATIIDFVCIQSFVLFTSNLVPLPGASGGAELAFTMYFGGFFIIGNINKIKPAILLWRFVTYYASIIVSAPFSYYTKDKDKEENSK